MPDSAVLNLHNSLRQAKERWAVFLGAGASYDYGIPTMPEIATILRKMIQANKPDHSITEPTLDLLRDLCAADGQNAQSWNIEDLLTRLFQLLDAATDSGVGFTPTKTVVGSTELSVAAVTKATEELTRFMADMCSLESRRLAGHGAGSIEYLSDFLLAMATFGKPATKLIRVFTTNIDLCIEAAAVRLSQRTRAERRPDLVLVDGFETGVLPIFSMNCYRRRDELSGDRCAVYYWKLHGSVDWTYSQPVGKPSAENPSRFSNRSIIVRRVADSLRASLESCGALTHKTSDGDQPIVIFPTPAKYLQTYTVPYMDLFEAFRRTLEEVELLICIGTSFPDQHIRSAIRAFVERDNTLFFVIDPDGSMEALQKLFGPSRSLQPVISSGLLQFVKDFKALDAIDQSLKASGGGA